MAKNYNLYEVATILNDGKDNEAIVDITRRYGGLAILMTKALMGDASDVIGLMNAMPKYITANKINSNIKNGKFLDGLTSESDEDDEVEAEDEETEDEVEDEKPVKKAKAKKSEETEGAWIDSAKGPALFKAAQSVDKSLGKGKKIGELKELVQGLIDDGYLDENGERTDKEYEVAAEEKPAKSKKAAVKKEEPVEDAEDSDESDEEDDPKKAVELFKQCKKLGIKVKPKQTAAFYQEKIDEFNASKSDDEESDDEESDDEESDDGDDWDI